MIRLVEQLGYFGIRVDRFDQDNLAGIQVQSIRSVWLPAAFHQNIRELLGVGIRIADNVEDVRQCGIADATARPFVEVDDAIT